jgi:hypothetical protein
MICFVGVCLKISGMPMPMARRKKKTKKSRTNAQFSGHALSNVRMFQNTFRFDWTTTCGLNERTNEPTGAEKKKKSRHKDVIKNLATTPSFHHNHQQHQQKTYCERHYTNINKRKRTSSASATRSRGIGIDKVSTRMNIATIANLWHVCVCV